ncbi:carbohydrate ABC transporter permease [Sporofaciens sp. JLR.KK001]|uniref:carbohydrate ABC transporter permease n=1 Tax=Sporofaciens sp. JLR.KK001 TaxID=3112621 RepID=UPI002FF401E1
MSRKGKRRMISLIRGIFLLLVCIACLFPFIWMIMVSLRNRVDILDPSKIFVTPTLKNYQSIIEESNILDFFKNSFIIAVISTLISLAIGSFAAYGFARYSWKTREDRAFWVLSQKFLPPMAVVIPYFMMASIFGLLDTRLVLIICYTTFNIPFTIWMMRGFIEDMPIELEEAGWVDGCSRLTGIIKILLPLITPGLVATSIFCVINSWNEFVFANFLTSIQAKTIPTSVMMYLSVSGVKWGEMAATGVMAVLPVLIFAIIVQKHMIRGLTFGSVKG